MMEKWAIIVISIMAISWFVLSFLTFFLINRTLKREYRNFYPHPLVGIVKDINRDSSFSKTERIFSYIVLGLWFVPITAEWFIAWVLWQLVKLFIKPNNKKSLEEKANYIEPEIKIVHVPKTLRDLYEKLPIQIEEDQFLKLYNMVEAELSLEYCPLTHVENLKLDETNKVKYSNFTYNVVRVISVFNKDNVEVKFKCFPKSLKVFKPGINEICVKYNYTPKTKVALDAETSYPLVRYFNAFMFGVLGEYYLQLSDFEKASDYNTLYKREISALNIVEKENK